MSVLPEIVMPKVAEPEAEPEQLVTKKLPETELSNMEMIDELQDLPVKEEIEIDEVEEQEDEEEDVFSEIVIPSVKPIIAPEGEFPVKKGKRKYVRKQPMSDKQREHLTKIRKIAIEKRKAEKERKIKEKEEAVIEKAEQKILEKRKKEREKKIAEAELDAPLPIPETLKNRAQKSQLSDGPQMGFTKDDLDNAVLSAITQYDGLRKQQKKEKRVQDYKDKEEAKMRETLERAIKPQPVQHDPWRNLFT